MVVSSITRTLFNFQKWIALEKADDSDARKIACKFPGPRSLSLQMRILTVSHIGYTYYTLAMILLN